MDHLAIYVMEGLPFAHDVPQKLGILICLRLALFHSVYSSFYSNNYHPLLYLVFDAVLFNIDQVLPTTPLLMYLSRL